ncbi:MAG: tetratricopeptide repeat protein [Deltaproteobacteria bacterium]|nr:tetratricopeptide repeat protein [Deltaproteobacteria bacterium]
MKSLMTALLLLIHLLGTGVPAHALDSELQTLNKEVISLYRQGRYDDAAVVAQKALQVAEQSLGPNHPDVAECLNNLAGMYKTQGQYAQAEPLFRRSLAIREKALDPDHPDVAESFNNLAGLYYTQGQYAQAEPLLKRSLAITEKVLGPDHPNVAASLNNIAMLYLTQGQYAQAEPLFKRSLEIKEKALGHNHLDVAISLNSLAGLYYTQGKYAQAELFFKRSLAIHEQALGPDHSNVALGLYNLASLYHIQGQYAQAEPLYKRSLAIKEKVLGPNHPDVATSLNNLAELYRTQGKYVQAELLYKRSLAIYEKALGPDHPNIAATLNNLATLYETQGQYAKAEPLYKRSLAIIEKALGPDHPNVAACLTNLASLYLSQGKYAQALPLNNRSLTIREKALGLDHPDVAISLNSLAELDYTLGQYAQAEPLFKRSLAIREKALGPDHINIALNLNNLAVLYRTQGQYEQAEPLYKRSLAIKEKALGPNHPDVATSLNNLASLYRTQGQYAQAEPLIKRSLTITELALGPDHPDVATSLNNLASLYRTQGQYTQAEPLFKRALAISEKVLGPNHPDVAIILNNLALLYDTQSQYALSEPLYKRSLEIHEQAHGPQHPNVAVSQENLALLYASTDRHKESHASFQRTAFIKEINREISFQILSEKQKINFMKTQESGIHAFINHTVESMASSPEAATDTFNAWLRWKGTVAEAQGRYQEAATRSTDPKIKAKFDELTGIRRELARLQLSKPEKLSSDDYRASIEKLEKQKEALEAELSRLSKDFALEKTAGRADTKALVAILPKDSIYIDFARIWTYDFKKNAPGPEKYFAFMLIPSKGAEVKLIEVADAEPLEKLLKTYLQEMNRIKTKGEVPDREALTASTRAIHDVLIKPFEPYITGKKQLFISPDGNMNLIPFEILIAPDGKHLIEKYAISYIGAGRDIVRFADTATTQGNALIMADPDYNLGLKEKNLVAAELKLAGAMRGSVSRDASKLSFDPLPDTKLEADAIAGVLAGKMKMTVRNYQNKKALEDILFASEPPRILHLATHGYFLNDEENKASTNQTRGLVIKEKSGLGYDDFANIENPMLRSGIVLSGVNTSLKEGRDDGMVSAEKILGLRLKGTDLVVLSACETGVGDVKNGEGIFGLKRAFILSGVKSLVMSLWSVPSAETAELMTDFYTQMAEGKSKSNALQQAKLNMMQKKPNPFYWGAFVLTGKPD